MRRDEGDRQRIALHVEERVDEFVASGVTLKEARRRARLESVRSGAARSTIRPLSSNGDPRADARCPTRRTPCGRRSVASALLVACALAATSLAVPAVLRAQTFAPALFSGMQWRLIGPFRAGRSVAVTGVPGAPDHYYFGAVAGGVWETDNSGVTWHPIFDKEAIASIGAIAVAPSNAQVIYVATGEADIRTDISYGNGVYRSDDGGKTWRHLGLDDTRRIGRIVIDPANPDRVWVAALGHAFGPNDQRGVFRSNDGGKTWKKTLYRDANTGAIDVALDPSNANTIYAALWAARRPPWNVYPPSNGYGAVYKSTDGGDTWQPLGGGIPGGAGVGRIGIAVAPSAPRRVYAQVDAEKGGVYRSDDGGKSWTLTANEERIWHRGWYFGSVTVDPLHADVLYVMNTSVYRSTDGGRTWEAFKGAPGGDDYHQLWINPNDDKRMILASDQGTIVSVNGGGNWSSWNNQPTGQFYHVATDDRAPYRVYGAEQDNGARVVVSRSGAGAISYRDWDNSCAGGESGYIAVDPANWRTLYGTSYNGSVTRCDQETGARWDVSPTAAYPESQFQAKWTMPVVFSQAGSHALYFGNEYVWRTTDGGESWDKASPILTRKNPGAPPNLDAATADDLTAFERSSDHWGVVYTIAPSPLDAKRVWAGTDDGLIWLTADACATWRDITPPALKPWAKVSMIEASRQDAHAAYAAVDTHALDDFDPHLYRTTDDGRTWQEIDSGIPKGAYVHAIREDEVRPGLLFAGTELGVYVSFDDGGRWQPLQLNLPTTSIRDFAERDNDLIVATHGRAFWVLDDIAALRQLDAKVASANAWLFRPDKAVLLQGRGRRAPSPVVEPYVDPVDFAAGENPPAGAVIDYYLAQDADSVSLDVLDAKGDLVRKYSSGEKPRRQNPATMDIPAAWAATPEVLSAAAGMHRWTWDLHWALAGGAAGGAGPWAPPGAYTVRLTARGQTLTQPIVVVADPASMAPDGTYAAQLTMARTIHAASQKAGDAVAQATALRGAIVSATSAAKGNASLVQALSALDAKAHDLLGHTAVPNPDAAGVGDGGPAPDTLLALRGTLNGLERAAAGGENLPSAQVRIGFQKMSATLDATLGKWAALQANDMARVNGLLKKEQLRELPVGGK
jgi:photosystem II stability/assembly factor-like uncharacterized protein